MPDEVHHHLRNGRDLAGKSSEDKDRRRRGSRPYGEPGSRHMGENAIERDPPFFVGIEAFIDKIAQKASILRNALA